MKHTKIIGLMMGALMAMPVAGRAQEAQEEPQKPRNWLVAFRFGGFSDSSGDSRFHDFGKFTGYNPSPEVTGGLDVSRFIGNRSGLTLSFEGLTFAGSAVVMAPMTLTYKFYPLGNGVAPSAGGRPPAVQPWIGAGGGLYTFILDDEAITDTEPGAQVLSLIHI